jgi:hypothetical protein
MLPEVTERELLGVLGPNRSNEMLLNGTSQVSLQILQSTEAISVS